MKNEYESLEMDIISFDCEDVIYTSEQQHPGGGDYPNTPNPQDYPV